MGFITIPLLLYILLTVAPSNNHWELICIAGAGERPVIAEHAERSPIIIQNGSSIPSSQKKFGLMTVRASAHGATFNMRGQLYRGHANATALSSSQCTGLRGGRPVF